MNTQDIEHDGQAAPLTGAVPRSDPAPAPAPEIAVVIPHYNDLVRLDRCLAVLTAGDLTGTEIVVADNASTVALDTIMARYPAVRFVTETRKGAGHARNAGVAATTAPILAFTDSDCLPAADWLAMARQTGRRRDGDIWGGRIDVFDETPPPRSGAEAFEAVFAFDWKNYIEKKGFTVTANAVTRRDVFDSTGPFQAVVTEDKEWCLRAAAKGWRVRAAPEMRVGHPSRADWPALRRKWERTTRETYELEGGSKLRWALKALAMPVSALAHLPRLLLSKRLAGPRERLAGAGVLVRLRWLRMLWMLRQATGREI